MMIAPSSVLALLLSIHFLAPQPARAADVAKDKRRPAEFAIIFNMGYAGDALPRDPAQFEKLVLALKAANYNVVLCKYDDWRAEICAKHGLKIMVDLLVPEHHIYKNVEGAEKLCTGLRDSEAIYAYHLWSDRIGGTIAGRSRDVGNVHKWDPNHPAYIGGYNGRAVADLENADIIGYYDFHWKRLGLWRHLQRVLDAAKKTDSAFLKYADGAPGKIGVGNYNRVMYTVSMSVAYGLKGYTFHHVGAEIDKASWKWNALGEDLARVNAEVVKLGAELIKIGNPVAVYSTTITKTAKNRDTGSDQPIVPEGLTAVPADSWFRVTGGEALIGEFSGGHLVFANHNAYEPQKMALNFPKGVKEVSLFDRKTGEWRQLQVQANNVVFDIPPAAPEMIMVKR